jgi:hypothetical protein
MPAKLSNPASSVGTKKVKGARSGKCWGGTQPPFCFYPKGRRFADIQEVQRELLAALDGISFEDVRQCFQKWECCLDHFIQSQGQYFERD